MEPKKNSDDVLFRPFAAQESINTGGARARRIRLPRPLMGCLVVIVAVFLCSAITSFAADRLCYGALSQRLPLYPNATVTSRTHNLFAEFGMGNTVITMTTPDDPTTVRNFYGRATGAYMESKGNGSPFFTLARGQWDVSRGTNGEGSLIIVFGTCIQ